MSDIANYGIAIEIKNGLSALKSFKQAATSFDKGRMAALVAQKNMLEQMKKLHDGMYKQPIKPPTSPSSPRSPYKDSTPEAVTYTKTQAALTKRLEREEKERTRIAVGQVKARMKAEQEARRQSSARIKQAVGGITAPTGADGMREYYRKLEKDSLTDARAKTKEINKQSRADAARVSSLEKAKENVRNSALMTEKEASAAQRAAQSRIKSKIALAKSAAEVRSIVAQERASLRLAKKKSFLVNRMNASSKEFAGNMVSAFAIASAGVFVTQTGQNFESARNTMLSVSEGAEEAGENMQFVKDEAFRLGLGLTQATKGFAKLAAARGNLTLDDTKELFTGVSELSTVLGLSAEESNRALLAIQQMASKGKISAEELRLQLGEVLPQGIQLMADATKEAGLTVNGTVAEMSKLMEEGKLLSEDVLPYFAKNMKNAAQANGALEKALLSNRVAMNQMVTAAQAAADTTFTSGWSEGLSELFKATGQMLMDNKLLFEEFGEFMGSVFKGVAWVVENVFSPVLSALGSVFKAVNESAESFVAILTSAGALLLGRFYKPLKAVVKQMGGMKAVMRGIMFLAKRMFLPFFAGLAVLEEAAEFFAPSGKKTLLGFNIDDVKDPFSKWLDTLDKVWDKVSKVFGATTDADQVGSTRNVLPYNNETFNKPNTNSTTFVLQVDNTLEMNGEAMGRQVMRSESAKSAVRWQSGYGAGHNR